MSRAARTTGASGPSRASISRSAAARSSASSGPNGAGQDDDDPLPARPAATDRREGSRSSASTRAATGRRCGPASPTLPGELRLPERGTVGQLVASIGRVRGGLDVRRRDELAERLDLDLARRMRELSSGNRRKVALLLAFLADAELLVLDEPTNGLDPLMQHEFLSLVREARERWHDGVPLVARPERGPARGRPGRGPAGRADRGGRGGRRAQGRARQRVEVWFAGAPPAGELDRLPDLEARRIDGRRFTAVLTGPVQPLIQILGRHSGRKPGGRGPGAGGGIPRPLRGAAVITVRQRLELVAGPFRASWRAASGGPSRSS